MTEGEIVARVGPSLFIFVYPPAIIFLYLLFLLPAFLRFAASVVVASPSTGIYLCRHTCHSTVPASISKNFALPCVSLSLSRAHVRVSFPGFSVSSFSASFFFPLSAAPTTSEARRPSSFDSSLCTSSSIQSSRQPSPRGVERKIYSEGGLHAVRFLSNLPRSRSETNDGTNLTHARFRDITISLSSSTPGYLSGVRSSPSSSFAAPDSDTLSSSFPSITSVYFPRWIKPRRIRRSCARDNY